MRSKRIKYFFLMFYKVKILFAVSKAQMTLQPFEWFEGKSTIIICGRFSCEICNERISIQKCRAAISNAYHYFYFSIFRAYAILTVLMLIIQDQLLSNAQKKRIQKGIAYCVDEGAVSQGLLTQLVPFPQESQWSFLFPQESQWSLPFPQVSPKRHVLAVLTVIVNPQIKVYSTGITTVQISGLH